MAVVNQPMVVIGGLITSTFLTLVVLPVVYSWLAKPPARDDRSGHSSLRSMRAAVGEPHAPERDPA